MSDQLAGPKHRVLQHPLSDQPAQRTNSSWDIQLPSTSAGSQSPPSSTAPQHSSFWKRPASPAAAKVRTRPLQDSTALPRRHGEAVFMEITGTPAHTSTSPEDEVRQPDSEWGPSASPPTLGPHRYTCQKTQCPLEQTLQAQRSGGSPDLFASQGAGGTVHFLAGV